MRRALLAFAAAAMLLTPYAARADSKSDLAALWRNWAAVKSFHAEMIMPQNRSISMDMIVPDKVHETMWNGMQMIMIGSDMWMYQGGKWMKMPFPMPQMRSMFDRARTMGTQGKSASDYTVTYVGPDTVNGVAAQHYRLVSKTEKPVEMWMGDANHLPAQVQVQTDQGVMTIVYSKYNQVPDILPPV